jgi:hypothetical protein
METSYPIVLTSTKEGYTAYIPDFNLTVKGEKQSDAIDAAKKAVYLWALSEENAEKSIPKPFSTNGIVAKSGQIVTLVDVFLEDQQRMVQKSIAIPCWLNELAEKENIDFSQVLQEGLKEKLHV